MAACQKHWSQCDEWVGNLQAAVRTAPADKEEGIQNDTKLEKYLSNRLEDQKVPSTRTAMSKKMCS